MSFRDFVHLAEQESRLALIPLPMAKLRDAVSLATVGRRYSAVMAAMAAGESVLLNSNEETITRVALTYRISPTAFGSALLAADIRYLGRRKWRDLAEALSDAEQLIGLWHWAVGIKDFGSQWLFADAMADLALNLHTRYGSDLETVTDLWPAEVAGMKGILGESERYAIWRRPSPRAWGHRRVREVMRRGDLVVHWS